MGLKTLASGAMKWGRKIVGYGVVGGGAIYGGNEIRKRYTHDGMGDGVSMTFNDYLKSFQEKTGITFGGGSIIGAVLGAVGFMFDPVIGGALMLAGVFAGQPALDALTKWSNTPAAPASDGAQKSSGQEVAKDKAKETPAPKVEVKEEVKPTSGLPPQAQAKPAPNQAPGITP